MGEARIEKVELKVTLADGREAEATIDAEGNIWRSGDYDTMCDIVEPTEAMRGALFSGSFMFSEPDQ